MKRYPLYILALTTLVASAAQAQSISYVPIPLVTAGVTDTKVEMLRSNLTLTGVQATYVGDGKSAVDATPQNLNVYIGPSTSQPNPLLQLTPITPTSGGGMVILEPVPGLSTVEVSFELDESPIRTAWKLPLLGPDDFFAANSTVWVQNLIKATDAASNLQIFNPGNLAATCTASVLRPKGTVIEERSNITVPAQGVVAITDILRKVAAVPSAGINVAVSCNAPFYALGSYPATNRWDTAVEYPITTKPANYTSEVLDHRPGVFFHVTQGNSDLKIPVDLDPSVNYHVLTIDFDAAVADPNTFVVFRNIIGMFRHGGRRFDKTLYFGSFDNFGKQKYVIDVGTPFIETTLKRSIQLLGGRNYHFTITVNNDQQSIHYVITNGGGTVMDVLGGLYNNFNVVDGNAPIIEMGLTGIADNAYFPPIGWKFSNWNLAATH
jgi:hypothetical protein